MRALVPLLFLPLVLAGCAETASPDGPDGALASGLHVLVVGGTVKETGPEGSDGGVCDVAAPPFSADDDERTLWYVPSEWYDDPRDGDLAVVRVDRTDWVWDDGCWVYGLNVLDGGGDLTWYHRDVPQTTPVRLEEGGVRVGGVLLTPGDETPWTISASCRCDPHGGGTGDYHYEGTLRVRYLGEWGEPVILDDHRDLPPLDVPFWDGW